MYDMVCFLTKEKKMHDLRVVLQNVNGSPTAKVLIPPPCGRRVGQVVRLVEKELGAAVYRDLDINVLNDSTWALSLRVYPHAEKDTVHRMLLLQWATMRLAEYRPTIDVSNLRAMQRLH